MERFVLLNTFNGRNKFCNVKNDKDKLELIDYINDKLPPQSGCFFGRTELKDDAELDYYRESLYDTMKFIRIAKKYIEKFGADIYYQSSWWYPWSRGCKKPLDFYLII